MSRVESDLSAVATFFASVVCVLAWGQVRRSQQAIQELENSVSTLKKLREDERSARINLQKARRENVTEDSRRQGYQYRAIGHMRTPFDDRRGTPRQPLLVPAARGYIVFDKHIVQTAHFEELKQFSHLWVLFVFHENTNTDKESSAAKIKPPRLHGKKVGTLSTRSPHRPNNIGLSVCEIVSVSSDRIEVSGIDFVDGTPVIDVKPYIPYDIVPSSYQLPMATTSTGEPLPRRMLKVPDWVVDSDIPLVPVAFTSAAESSLASIFSSMGNMKSNASSNNGRVSRTAEEARTLIEQVLRQDIRGFHQGRGQSMQALTVEQALAAEQGTSDPAPSSPVEEEKSFECRLDGITVCFRHLVDGILVHSISTRE